MRTSALLPKALRPSAFLDIANLGITALGIAALGICELPHGTSSLGIQPSAVNVGVANSQFQLLGRLLRPLALWQRLLAP